MKSADIIKTTVDHTLSVAPMMDWTDRHCRYFHRLMSPHALLYTEMVTTGALLNGETQRFLAFDTAEQPLVLQLGGSDPADMARCAILAESAGYREVNINVGCPSDRVQSGRFGACLMSEPKLVAECVGEMSVAVKIPITVKTRIGIDDFDDYEFLKDFVDTVSTSGCSTFIIHARKAILKGLSPKQNRSVPPINYERAYRLKNDFPQLTIVLNGEVNDVDAAAQHLMKVDGLMIGRKAYHDPYFLAELDANLFSQIRPYREEVLHQFLPYLEQQISKGVALQSITRHLLGLFAGMPGGRYWRRYISENAHKKGASIDVLLDALKGVKLAQKKFYDNKNEFENKV
jgi:tRNA-dihydrouridine synthase A